MNVTPEEEAEAENRIHTMAGLLNEVIVLMQECPFPYSDEVARVGVVMAILQKFEPGHNAVMAAVAIDRLCRLIGNPAGVLKDVEGGEDYFIELTAALMMTPSWARDTDRPAKIQAVAGTLFGECGKEQLALLAAIGMVRLSEGGLGSRT